MKKLIQIIASVLLSLGMAQVTHAQHLTVTTYLEHTPVNAMLGTSLGYTFSCGREVGLFYQSHYKNINTFEETTVVTEREFIGGFFTAPIKCWERASVYAGVRAGVANGSMFIISPNINANYKISKRVHFSAGVALRSIVPSVITSIKIDLGKI